MANANDAVQHGMQAAMANAAIDQEQQHVQELSEQLNISRVSLQSAAAGAPANQAAWQDTADPVSPAAAVDAQNAEDRSQGTTAGQSSAADPFTDGFRND